MDPAAFVGAFRRITIKGGDCVSCGVYITADGHSASTCLRGDTKSRDEWGEWLLGLVDFLAGEANMEDPPPWSEIVNWMERGKSHVPRHLRLVWSFAAEGLALFMGEETSVHSPLRGCSVEIEEVVGTGMRLKAVILPPADCVRPVTDPLRNTLGNRVKTVLGVDSHIRPFYNS